MLTPIANETNVTSPRVQKLLTANETITNTRLQSLLAAMARAAVNMAESQAWPERFQQWEQEYKTVKAQVFQLLKVERA